MEANNYLKFLEKYLKNEHSDTEHQVFLSWFRSLDSQTANEVLEQFALMNSARGRVGQLEDLLPLRKSLEEQLDLMDAENLIGELNSKTKTWLKVTRYLAAAALVIIVGYFAFTSLRSPLNEGPETAEVSTSTPKELDSSKAVLHLADGTTYYLNDVDTGAISNKNGVEIRKLGEGALQFLADIKHQTKNTANQGKNIIRTPKSGQYQIELMDGTKVWLNALSSIEFPSVFDAKQRVIELNGEAYFEVNPYQVNGKKVPFFVRTPKQEIEVLGTHFNVNSYQDEAVVKTTLLEGSVKVSALNETKNKVMLKPGQQSILTDDEEQIKVLAVDAESAISWKDGFFNFKGADIQEVMRQLARWYDLEVNYIGTPPKEQFTGYIPKKMELETVLKILEEGGGVKFVLKDKLVIIRAI